MKRLKVIQNKMNDAAEKEYKYSKIITEEDVKWLISQVEALNSRVKNLEGQWKPIKIDGEEIKYLYDKYGKLDPKVEKFMKQKSQSYGISVHDLVWCWEYENGRCYLCGSKLKIGSDTHLDHVVPQSKGGLNHKDNVKFACSFCNYSKRDINFKDFIALCLKISDWNKDTLTSAERQEVFKDRWARENREIVKIVNTSKNKNVRLIKKASTSDWRRQGDDSVNQSKG